MHVGFDVDDVALFSAPVVQKVLFENPGKRFEEIPEMYQRMNCGMEVRYSMTKQVTEKLIKLHKKRGDQIFFITARGYTDCVDKDYGINQYLAEIYQIDNMNPVIFTNTEFGPGTKATWLMDHKISVYYGDSDSDIQAAQNAGALGVRVIRAANSDKQEDNRIGCYSEPVLKHSDH